MRCGFVAGILTVDYLANSGQSGGSMKWDPWPFGFGLALFSFFCFRRWLPSNNDELSKAVPFTIPSDSWVVRHALFCQDGASITLH